MPIFPTKDSVLMCLRFSTPNRITIGKQFPYFIVRIPTPADRFCWGSPLPPQSKSLSLAIAHFIQFNRKRQWQLNWKQKNEHWALSNMINIPSPFPGYVNTISVSRREISSKIRRRFPTIRHIVDSGLMTEKEFELLNKISVIYSYITETKA